MERIEEWKKYVSFGWTLTGCDNVEPNASTNEERIEAMKKLHNAGFKTFASIEPIIDFGSSFDMMIKAAGWCDLFKVGLESGKKYDKKEITDFVKECIKLTRVYEEYNKAVKIYFKDSLLKQAGINREDLPNNCVNRDYNIFNN